MSNDCDHKGDKKEDTDAEWLVLEESGDAVHAVLSWRALSDVLEVVEDTIVADAVAVEGAFEFLSELSNPIIEFLCTLGCLCTLVICCLLYCHGNAIPIGLIVGG